MTGSFEVKTTPQYDRLLKKLIRKERSFLTLHLESLRILASDPYNRTRGHQIKKLVDTDPSEGQFRLRLGRYRFLYSVFGNTVVLYRCSLRREDTY